MLWKKVKQFAIEQAKKHGSALSSPML